MKLIQALVLFGLTSSVANAAEISVNVPKGTSYIRAESHFHRSGCSNSTVYLAVVRDESSGTYVASRDLSVPDLNSYLETLSSELDRGSIVTCMAFVKITTAAAFVHHADRAETVKVVFPGEESGVEVSVTAVQ